MTGLKSYLAVFLSAAIFLLNPAHSDASSFELPEPTLAAEGGDPLTQWCNSTIRVLQDAKSRAARAASWGDMSRAQRELVQGLQRALDSAYPSLQGTGLLTYKALTRGVQLARELASSLHGEKNGVRTLVYFLNGYYDFTVYTARSLDVPYTIPYRRCGGGCGYDSDTYERNFLEYTRRQVQLVLTTLASSDGYRRVTPVGAPSGYLKALELTTEFAASDLRESIWAYNFACPILELEELNQKLCRFNARDRFDYYDEYEAINSSYWEARSVLDDLGSQLRCRGRY